MRRGTLHLPWQASVKFNYTANGGSHLCRTLRPVYVTNKVWIHQSRSVFALIKLEHTGMRQNYQVFLKEAFLEPIHTSLTTLVVSINRPRKTSSREKGEAYMWLEQPFFSGRSRKACHFVSWLSTEGCSICSGDSVFVCKDDQRKCRQIIISKHHLKASLVADCCEAEHRQSPKRFNHQR